MLWSQLHPGQVTFYVLANKVETKIGTWRSFATEWLVSPSNDLYSCSFLIWSHVQPLIRFLLACLLPPRLQPTSPLPGSKLRPSVGSHSTALPVPAQPPTSCSRFSFAGVPFSPDRM